MEGRRADTLCAPRYKTVLPDDAMAEMLIWRVPEPGPPTTHGFTYRLFYGCGQRLVGYDNERGKGDHRHVLGRESRYAFVSVEKLVADFLADVGRVRSET